MIGERGDTGLIGGVLIGSPMRSVFKKGEYAAVYLWGVGCLRSAGLDDVDDAEETISEIVEEENSVVDSV